MPESPANLHTFNELRPNELTDAAELIRDGSLRAHVVRLLAAANDRRHDNDRVAIAKASWAIERPEMSVQACFGAASADVGVACIHAQNLTEILTLSLMPTTNDATGKRIASAIRNSTLAVVGTIMRDREIVRCC